jgi:hypothetical protein
VYFSFKANVEAFLANWLLIFGSFNESFVGFAGVTEKFGHLLMVFLL